MDPSEVYRIIDIMVDRLRATGMDPTALEAVQSTAYTTNSEWLGELRKALRTIERLPLLDPELRKNLKLLRNYTHGNGL